MAQVNGDRSSSLFIDHLLKYPVINSSVTGFKNNAYGQKSISIADQGYATIAKPVIPYFAGPYSYISPYVQKADSIADHGLTKIDETFPVVKTPTDKIQGTVTSYAVYPFQLAGDARDHVFKVWTEENKKNSGSILTPFKSLVTTSLNLTSDSLGWVVATLQQGKQEAEKVAKEKTRK